TGVRSRSGAATSGRKRSSSSGAAASSSERPNRPSGTTTTRRSASGRRTRLRPEWRPGPGSVEHLVRPEPGFVLERLEPLDVVAQVDVGDAAGGGRVDDAEHVERPERP